MKYILFIFISLISFNLPEIVNAQNDNLNDYTKRENFVFPGKQFSGIEVNNEHGNITISANTADTFQVKILISVKGTEEEFASEILDKINIRKSERGQNLYLRTDFGDSFQPNHPFSIHYDIQMPAQKALDIKNRFGDISINSISGNQTIKLEYGQLVQKGIATIDSLNCDLSFVDAEFVNIRNAKLDLYNVNAQTKSIIDGEISGKYCQIDLLNAGKIKIKTSTSRFSIGSIKRLSLKGDFCFTSIKNLSDTGDIEIANGLLIISSVSSTLKELSIFNNNAPINLSLPNNLSYTLHGEVTNGQFRHYAAKNFRIIRELDKISFSGTINNEQSEASIVLFNENAEIIIEE
ncbi:hypothetical protein [Marinilabilia rubra]|uniref:Adhesin domain-containing protein n=1 Tax=Marinilabilia rubra TaxID=2162893 RepID=A0A2U2BCD0_9BACT|nr:hypothetical protein [Marinilabilia rubra]PWE00726.1 hypothetical protein DDZ16_03795 [Marinilabilia rubra]